MADKKQAKKKKTAKKKAAKKANGRPTIFTDSLSDKICERVALGQSMRTICKLKSMPAMTTIFKWLRENDEFKQQYGVAKQECADLMAEDILQIADNEVSEPLIIAGKPVKDGKNIVMLKTATGVQHARLRVDSRKWLASKLKPKKYGDRVQHANDEDSPLMTPPQLVFVPHGD